ncbi:hypothetical protein BDQ12DRAFT_494184 [Crucibulum laeve]|uniref:Uncharacterized protein n=1 Tax=Crucibulum laeve TaxID=68775 RepID=A0A5C3M4L9_9AGAR|nr:hypothetical protein BDQ12DRAFT_494184 [Crucibulum laeve]
MVETLCKVYGKWRSIFIKMAFIEICILAPYSICHLYTSNKLPPSDAHGGYEQFPCLLMLICRIHDISLHLSACQTYICARRQDRSQQWEEKVEKIMS